MYHTLVEVLLCSELVPVTKMPRRSNACGRTTLAIAVLGARGLSARRTRDGPGASLAPRHAPPRADETCLLSAIPAVRALVLFVLSRCLACTFSSA